ncbi:unnamed protein product [Alternaria alternata]
MATSSSSSNTTEFKTIIEHITPIPATAVAERLLPNLREEMACMIPGIVSQTLSQREVADKHKNNDSKGNKTTGEYLQATTDTRMPPPQQYLQKPLPHPLPQPPLALQHQSQAIAITPTQNRRVSDKEILKRIHEYKIREGIAQTREVTNAGVAVTVALKPDGSHFEVQDEAAVDWSGKESDISGMSLSGHRVDKNNGESGQVKKKEG